MDRATLLELWNASWDGDIWIAPWSKALAGLTAEQAAWQPAAGRHSIWQNTTHVTFWREVTLDGLAGKSRPPDAVIAERQFAGPDGPPTIAAWHALVRRFEEVHKRTRDAIADQSNALDRLRYHLAHDAYHLGQIMYVRALQGLDPVM